MNRQSRPPTLEIDDFGIGVLKVMKQVRLGRICVALQL
jgi:hypothetical protein